MEVLALILVLAATFAMSANEAPKGVATPPGAGVAKMHNALIRRTLTAAKGGPLGGFNCLAMQGEFRFWLSLCGVVTVSARWYSIAGKFVALMAPMKEPCLGLGVRSRQADSPERPSSR